MVRGRPSPSTVPGRVAPMDAYLLAVDSVADLLARPEVAAAWESPSALAEWSVGGLAGHLAGQVFAGVNLHRGRAEPPGTDRARRALPTGVVDRRGRRRRRQRRHPRRRRRVRRCRAPGPLARVRRRPRPARPPAGGDLARPARPGPWQGWALRRDDFLVMRMMEITVHSDDLAASVGISAPALPDEVLGPVLGAADPAGRPSPRPVRRGHRAEPGRASARRDQCVLGLTPARSRRCRPRRRPSRRGGAGDAPPSGPASRTTRR